MTLNEIKKQLRAGPYAWPGGYPLFFITEDGAALSFEAVRAEWRNIVDAHLTVAKCPSARHNMAQWTIAGCDVNWEDTSLYCEHTGKQIESAYGDEAVS